MSKKSGFVSDITAILVKNGIIESSEARALQESFKRTSQEQFDAFLIEEGIITRASLLQALSQYYKVPACDIQGAMLEHRLLVMFPEIVLERNSFIPLLVDDESILVVAASDPSNEELLPIIGKYVSYDVQFQVGIEEDILEAINEFYDPSDTEVRKSPYSEDDNLMLEEDAHMVIEEVIDEE